MILVGVSGDNALGGSFYVDSPVSGRWASAIVDDVVTAIDQQYRTLPTSASRGIAGFSMGGYGALALAMENPDVFGAVYALSPGLFAPGGLAESQMFADPTVAADFLAGQPDSPPCPRDAAAELPRVMGRSGDAPLQPPRTARRSHPTRTDHRRGSATRSPSCWCAPTRRCGQLWEAGFGGLAAQVEDARERPARAARHRHRLRHAGLLRVDPTWLRVSPRTARSGRHPPPTGELPGRPRPSRAPGGRGHVAVLRRRSRRALTPEADKRPDFSGRSALATRRFVSDAKGADNSLSREVTMTAVLVPRRRPPRSPLVPSTPSRCTAKGRPKSGPWTESPSVSRPVA